MQFEFNTSEQAGQNNRLRIWIDPRFGIKAGREVHDAWRRMIRNKMRVTGYQMMSLDEKLDFEGEVAGMKARAYLDATEAMMADAGISEGLRRVRELRDNFEARVGPDGVSSDTIGMIYTARACETMLLDEIRTYNLGADLRDDTVEDPFEAPVQYRSIKETLLDFA